MSEIRVDRIGSKVDKINISGITTFSGTGSFGIPLVSNRPNSPRVGQVVCIESGTYGNVLQFFDGTSWDPF